MKVRTETAGEPAALVLQVRQPAYRADSECLPPSDQAAAFGRRAVPVPEAALLDPYRALRDADAPSKPTPASTGGRAIAAQNTPDHPETASRTQSGLDELATAGQRPIFDGDLCLSGF
jgi:hypothetical protein